MGIEQPHIIDDKENNVDEIKQVLLTMKDLFEQAHDSLSIGVELYDLSIPNELTDGIQRVIDSPIESGYVAYLNLRNSIIQMIDDNFRMFLTEKKNLFEKVYRVSDKNLHYAIILIEDSIDSEAELLEFKMSYDEKPVSKSFPLIISFPNLDELENAKLSSEIDFELAE